jgi:integrase
VASVQKRGEGSYLLVVEAGYKSDGSRAKRTKTVKADGIREARKLLAEFQTEVEAGEYISPEKMKVADFIEDWRTKYAQKELESATLATYNVHIKNRIIPYFGHMRLDQVKAIHVVNFLSSLDSNIRMDGKEGGLSSGTIQFVHRVLKNIFSRACDWKLIKVNPLADIKKPKVTQKEMQVYDEQETALLFQTLEDEPIEWRMMVILALTTGLRRAELLGLEFEHIDMVNGTVLVKQSITMSENGERRIKAPKTKSSVRKVSLTPSVLDDLKEYYLHERKKKLRVGDKWKGGEHFFVFSSWDGQALYPTSPTMWWRRFIIKSGLKHIRFHDLRHTAATLLINQGVHAKTISDRLGHASISTTMNVYGHHLQVADQEAANKLEGLFSNRKKKSL